MTAAREQARAAADEIDGTEMEMDDWLDARTDAASAVWEPLVREALELVEKYVPCPCAQASTCAVCQRELPIIKRLREALG